MKSVIAAMGLCLSVAGCGLANADRISRLDANDIRAVSDRDLCSPYAGGAVVAGERGRRELGDCTPDHQQCKALGYQPGSTAYLQCRTMLGQQHIASEQAQQAAASEMVAAGAAIMQANQPPPPQPLQPIQMPPRPVQCSSYPMGNTVQTTCR